MAGLPHVTARVPGNQLPNLTSHRSGKYRPGPSAGCSRRPRLFWYHRGHLLGRGRAEKGSVQTGHPGKGDEAHQRAKGRPATASGGRALTGQLCSHARGLSPSASWSTPVLRLQSAPLTSKSTQPPKPLLLSCLLTRRRARNLTKKRGRPRILQQFPTAFTPKSPSSGLQKLATGSSFSGRFSTPSHSRSPSPFCPTSGDHSLLSLGSALPCPVNLLPLSGSS